MPSFSRLAEPEGFFIFTTLRPRAGLSIPNPSAPFRAETLKDHAMFKLPIWALALAGASLVSTACADTFADAVIDYTSGTGFAAGFTNPAVVLGAPTSTANPFSPAFRNTQIVSLGAGGSLTVRFDTPIQNDSTHPYGLDFTVFGNAGFTITNGNFSGGGITDGSLFGNNAGSTRVWVSADNLTYYQLNPLLAPVVDGLYPTAGTGNFNLPVNPTLGPGAFAGQNLAGIAALYGGSAGGSSFDISWAQDTLGNSVFLNDINYVRVDVLTGKSEIDGFSIVVAPEPAAWALLLPGLLLLGLWRRRVQSSPSQRAYLGIAPDCNLIGARRLRRFIVRKQAGQFFANVIQTLKRPEGRAPGALHGCTPSQTSPDRIRIPPTANLRKPLPGIAKILFVLCATSGIVSAGTFTENFATDPASNGWLTFGNSNLFQWDSTNHDMQVTWDSSQPNSYFYHPLGTNLDSGSDFSISFDLQLTDSSATGFGFELAVGFLNLADATNSAFLRGTGSDSPNLLEFDYFPAGDFPPSLDCTAVDANNNFQFIYDPNSLPLVNSTLYHITVTHVSGAPLITGQVLSGGNLYTSFPTNFTSTNFAGFQVDTVSISSYNDANSGGSALAHGTVANIVVTILPPPPLNITGSFSNNLWQVQFASRNYWFYTLERTADFQSWSPASDATPGNGGALFLQDTNTPADNVFYRVQANRP